MKWTTQQILDDAKVIILDIETNSLDTDTAIARVVGIRTNKSQKVHCIWAHDFDKLRKAIRKAEHVVTFNGNKFDIPVLMNPENKLFKYESSITGKHLDLYDVVTAREQTFGVKFMDGFSLDAVCKTLGLSRKQDDFDYKLLYKEYDELTSQEVELIEKYLTQDINITYELYQFIEDMYAPLAEFLPKKDVKRKNYIKSSMGAMTYKIVCHMSGLEPLYSGDDGSGEGYKGGHVFTPIREETTGNIKVVDFTSAYPHAYMQGNLYTKCTGCTHGDCEFRFTGGATPDGHVLKLQGKYCTKYGMGVKERVIQKLFLMRLDAKIKIKQGEGDVNYLQKLQHALKIVINTIYGISGAPKFLNTYDVDTAADCTRICRFNLIYMHSLLTEFGYECLYGDTDSIFLNCDEDVTDDILQGHLDTVLKNLKSIYPFPQDTFKIDIEYSLDFVGFFKDDHGFKKKRYIMVFTDGSVKAKGIGMVVRRDCSKLSRKIWDDHAQQYISEHMTHKIPSHVIDMWVSDLVEADITIAGTEFNAKPLDHYNGMTSIHAQISKELGEGKHTLIKNVRGVGIGGGVKYATLEQAAEYVGRKKSVNVLDSGFDKFLDKTMEVVEFIDEPEEEPGFKVCDLDLTRVWSELSDVTASNQSTFDRFMVGGV